MLSSLNRRHSLRVMGAISAWTALASAQTTALATSSHADRKADPLAPQTVAMAWRAGAAPAEDSDPKAHRIGLLQVDWGQRRSTWSRVQPVPNRAHGLTPDGRGGLYAVAARPGDWLVHLPADAAHAPRWLHPGRDEASTRTLNGHLLLSSDGRWLYSSETGRDDGSAWVVRRDAQTLRAVAAWQLPGVDAHQMLFDADERHVLVALGGIPRDERGRRVPHKRLAPALLRLDTDSGTVQQRWALEDPRLSVRHMAWSVDGDQRLLGIALQAQHDERQERRNAPMIAVWDGSTLTLPPCPAIDHQGYAGDICAGPGGSFLLSAQRSGNALLWHPDAPDGLIPLGELKEVCALGSWRDARGMGMLMGAGRGLARWQAGEAQMLPWPEMLAPDNHLALLL